jgi:plastocyanin
MFMRMFARAAMPLVLVLGQMVAGCGSGSDSNGGATAAGPATTPPSGKTVHVAMQVLEFTPGAVGAKVGQTVVWSNEDSSPHNVTYVSGPRFRSSGRLDPGATFSLKLTSAGTIHYFCTLHPWMKATIVVSQ